jgi:hypothetical protein
MIDIQFIEFYISKKYNKNMCDYFNVSKPVLSVFDKCEDVKIVNALENLQPLCANENLSKYNHYN